MNKIFSLLVIGSVVIFAADPISKTMKDEKKYKAVEQKERENIKQEARETEKKASIKKKSYPRGTIETH